MTEWKEYKLGEIAEIVGGGTPDTSNKEYWGGNIPWLTPKDLTGYNKIFISSGERFITEEGLDNSSTKLLPQGTVLLSSRAPIGYVAIASNPICTNQGFKSIICNKDIVDNLYMYYWIKNNTELLQSLGTGTTFAEISGSVVKSIDISLPPLPEQIRIASILSSLDDKIDLLHRENKTLEAMAETLFRQWFIEEAKEDWKEGKLGDFVSVIDNRGKTPPYTDNITEYPIIEVNALTGEDRYVKYNLVKKYVEKDIYDFWFRGYFHKYDIFVSTVGSIGELAMCLEEKGVIAQNVIALHANNISPFYLYQYLNYNKDDLKGLDIGSVQPSIKVPHLLNMSIIIPPHDKLKEYDIIMLDIIEKEEKNIKQIQTLIQQRDSLLPKLMSGEVKI